MNKVIIACEDLFALDVLMIIEKINMLCKSYEVVGYLTIEDIPLLLHHSHVNWLGKIEDWEDKIDYRIVMAVVHPQRRKRMVEILRRKGHKFITIRAPWVLAPLELELGYGSIVAAESIKIGAHIGDFTIMYKTMAGAAEIGNFCSFMGYANITNAVFDECVYVGSNAVVLDKLKIGKNVYIESGSVVVRNVKDDARVIGVPAKNVK